MEAPVNLRTRTLTITCPDHNLRPEELLRIFNNNPDFTSDSGGAGGKTAYSLDEIRSWPVFTGQLCKNQRTLSLRTSDGQLIGIADLLAPHPSGHYAALGLLIFHRDWQSVGLGKEATRAIEDALSLEGWTEVEVAVLCVRPRSRRFWENCGYRFIREAANEDGLRCWILRKTFE